MAKYSILIKPSAVNEIENIPRKDRLRTIQKIQKLANTPDPRDVKSLPEKIDTESVREFTELSIRFPKGNCIL